MGSDTLREKAEALRRLHVPGRPLLLLNAWDAATARLAEQAGAPAVATSSAAAANALGYRDGEHIGRERMLGAVAAIAGAVTVPVTADMEAGYGDEPADAAATARGVIGAGAVGLNLEDTAGGDPSTLLPVERFLAKVAAVRDVAATAGVPLVLNARTDVFLGEIGAPADRLDHAIERGRAYLAAGADCVFVPGLADPPSIAAIVEALAGRVSVLATASSPPLHELGGLGVARVSVGSGPYRAALALMRGVAEAAYGRGDLAPLFAEQPPFEQTQSLLPEIPR